MKINHHLSDELLLEYAAGNLTEGWSLVVATHMALCVRPAAGVCRRWRAPLVRFLKRSSQPRVQRLPGTPGRG
jgi:anti-sigma factor ChrR (cupin superfamily)